MASDDPSERTGTCIMCDEPATERINIPGYGYREYCYKHARAIMGQAAANGMGLGFGE